jgi:carboxyl-terminal processing protease
MNFESRSLNGARSLHLAVFLALALLLASCGGGSRDTDGEGGAPDCLDATAKADLLGIMESVYFWNDQPRQVQKYQEVDLDRFADDEQLLGELRWMPKDLDRGFTYITSPAAEDRQNAGRTLSYGFSLTRVGDTDEIRVLEAIEGGAVHATGVRRGWQLLSIEGRGIAEIDASDGISAALGFPYSSSGTTRVMEFLDREGTPYGPFAITVTEFEVDPVPLSRIFERTGRKIGYVMMRSFVPPAVSAFEAVIRDFNREGVRDLVVDFRYNLGGSLPVAEAIGGMLGGDALAGETLYRLTFNSANSSANQSGRFEARYDGSELSAGTFDEIVFLTSARTASASELVIHGLTPFADRIDAASVGSRSYGKPVGQIAADYCSDRRRLRVVAFEVQNAAGIGGYFDGLPVDCPAADELDTDLGDPSEASLVAALEFHATGQCPSSGATGAAAAAAPEHRSLSITHRFDGIL